MRDTARRALRRRLLASPQWFPAQFPGHCGMCGDRYRPGAALTLPSPGRLGWRAECCAAEEDMR